MDKFVPDKSNRAKAICFISDLQGVALQALFRDGEMTIEELLAGF